MYSGKIAVPPGGGGIVRVKVSLFELSPEIEDRDEVGVGKWAKHKETF
jgi:hypothetical protein